MIVTFIDNEHQLYFSPSYGDKQKGEMNIVHFQSFNEDRYKNLKVNYCSYQPDISANSLKLSICNTNNEFLFYDGDVEEMDKQLIVNKIIQETISSTDIVSNCQMLKEGLVVFVKHKLRL